MTVLVYYVQFTWAAQRILKPGQKPIAPLNIFFVISLFIFFLYMIGLKLWQKLLSATLLK